MTNRPNSRTDPVARFVAEHGPCLSSKVIEHLQATGLTAEAARQRVARSSVSRLGGLKFPKNVRFLYLENHHGTVRFWEALMRDIHIASPAYAAAIACLKARGGAVPLRTFLVSCGSPVRQKGQLSAETVLERLSAIHLVRQFDVEGIGRCVSLAAGKIYGDESIAWLRAQRTTEQILLLAVRDWARKLGLASYDKITLRDDGEEPPKVGTFYWDLAGPSYLAPMVRRTSEGKPNPGFLVCDVLVGAEADEQVVAAFVRKHQLTIALKRVPPRLPILLADSFSVEGFRLGRSYGLMLATPATLFGREVAEGLVKLLATLTKAAAMAVHRPEVIDELMSSLGQIAGAEKNLRGAMFELLVGHATQKADDGWIDINKSVFSSEGEAEIDVLRIKEGREVWAYECKAYLPSRRVTLEEARHWLHDRVPRMQAALAGQQRFQGCDFHYEYWTTGGFEPDAQALLEEAAANTRRYKIGFKDGVAVRALMSKLQSKEAVRMLDKHFLHEPMARLDQRYGGSEAEGALTIEAPIGDLLEPAQV